MTISSPSLLIEVRMFVASDDATVGAVIGTMKIDLKFGTYHPSPSSQTLNECHRSKEGRATSFVAQESHNEPRPL